MSDHFLFVNTQLPYTYDALEPYIDTLTMHLHHDRHLQTYVDNLNKALEPYPQLWHLSLVDLIQKSMTFPQNVQKEIINNAGGVFNHRFYFEGMTPANFSKPTGRLVTRLVSMYGNLDNFKKEFKQAALSVFGSGYAWLVKDQQSNLSITTTANQNTPVILDLMPILCIDVWEHAYYLKHYNKRADYIDNWFQIVNWQRADTLL